jgi:hypothetical protein
MKYGGLLGGATDEKQGPGLLGGLLDISNPDAMNQLALIASLFNTRKGENWGMPIAQAAMRSRQIRESRQREEAQALEMERQRQEMERQQHTFGRTKALQELPGQFMRPGAAPSLTPNDDEGNPMPSTQPSMDWQRYIPAHAALDPQGALQMQTQLAHLNQREGPIKLNRNERLVDPRTGRVTLDAAPDLPAGMRMGANGPEYIPEYLQGQERIRAAGRQNTTVNMPAPERAFNVEAAKLDAKQLDEWRESATKAHGGLSRIQEMKRLSGDALYSGWGAEGRLGVANFFATMGLPVDQTKIANSQEYNKHAKELTLAMLKEGVGATNISNADLAFVNETVPQLATNPQARVNLLNYMERRLGESVDRYQSADEYARANNGLRGFRHGSDPRQPASGQGGNRPAKLQKNVTAIVKAQEAIKQGKPRELVIQRLMEQGYDPAGL